MKIEMFDFALPPELIAQHPVEPRDAARMLRVAHLPDGAPDGTNFTDGLVSDLPGLLNAGDVLVVNDTKVIPTRLFGTKGNGRVEATLHKQLSPDTWVAFCRPGKRFRVGDRILWSAEHDLTSLVLDRHGGEVTLHFNRGGADLGTALDLAGHMPLPPYIKREAGSTAADRASYQTLFADKAGAVAAPTAGLHFTPRLLAAIEGKGVKIARITLHVGAGTFLPVKAGDTDDHRMHSEWWQIGTAAAQTINAARRVIAVGTTSLRALESAAHAGSVKKTPEEAAPEETASGQSPRVTAGSGDTSVFITPGYEFKAVDALLTNFHLPKSTLFMLVSAFSGLETMQRAYAHAIGKTYRFFSYGDCCFLERFR